MWRCYSRAILFFRAEAGVTAIEFAVVAPVLLLLLMGIIEFSLIMLASNVLESATNLSSRLSKTGYQDAGVTREQTIINEVNSQAGSLLDTTKLTISSKFYQQFDQINDPEPWTDSNANGTRDPGEPYTDINGNSQWDADLGVAGYGGPGDIVVFTVSYPWAIATPIISNLVGSNGIFTITSHAVVRNEPY